jgi:DAK2 domain fusion protein YloV
MTLPSLRHDPTHTPDIPAPSIDGKFFKRLILAGFTWLKTNQQYINSLNVFPIPDGDTGTNMSLTMQAACQEIAEVEYENAGQVAHGIAHGALMGARGNSGVILSQILRGIARSLDMKTAIDTAAFAHALHEARETAYKGVVRPVEGTILTVATDIAAAARTAHSEGCSFPEMMAQIVSAADQSVSRTPDLLPILREAGVVDAGGKGLFFLLEGMLRYLEGKPLDEPAAFTPSSAALNFQRMEEFVEEGQDYEVVVDFAPHTPLDMPWFFQQLESMGTSIQIGQGDDLYRLHIHVPSEKRYEPIDLTIRLGTVSKVAIENLQEQTAERLKNSPAGPLSLKKSLPGHIAAVTVSPGPGLSRVFASLGVAAIIPGGQTMNPSTKEILHSFADLPTDRVIILPNNKNILMAAEQTSSLTDKKISIIPTLTIPQGIAAMLAFQSDGDLPEIAQAMTKAMDGVESGELTAATRSVEMNGIQVAEGQFIGLHNGKLISSGPSIESTLLDLLKKMGTEKRELITLYWGENLGASKANQLADAVRAAFPGQEVEIYEGGQPHYFFILSVE